jgi:hypothetical protein
MQPVLGPKNYSLSVGNVVNTHTAEMGVNHNGEHSQQFLHAGDSLFDEQGMLEAK